MSKDVLIQCKLRMRCLLELVFEVLDGFNDVVSVPAAGPLVPIRLRMRIRAHKIGTIATQSRQSTMRSLQSSKLGLSHPLTRRRMCTPPWLGGGGRPNSNEGQTLWYSSYLLYNFVNSSYKQHDGQVERQNKILISLRVHRSFSFTILKRPFWGHSVPGV